MRRFRTVFLGSHRRPVSPKRRLALALLFDALIARRLADPTQLAPGPDTPAAIPV